MAERVILVSTGEVKANESRLQRMEDSFASHLKSVPNFETVRLGNVDSLLVAYYNTIRLINDPKAWFIFVHCDSYPTFISDVTPEMESLCRSLPDKANYLKPSILNPTDWVSTSQKLISEDSTGFIGVAGATSLDSGIAWWNSPNLSGAVFHAKPNGTFSLNPYGPWGRVLVLDGLCLMTRGDIFERMGNIDPINASFHYYDMELCLQAHLHNLKNWTVPLLMTHESDGASFNNSEYLFDQKKFIARYKEILPIEVDPEILELY